MKDCLMTRKPPIHASTVPSLPDKTLRAQPFGFWRQQRTAVLNDFWQGHNLSHAAAYAGGSRHAR